MVAAVVVCAAIARALLGAAPYSRHYNGIWPLSSDPLVAVQTRAVASVPGDAAASVSYNIDTHMTHRSEIYEFPVLWCNMNWGVEGEHLADPGKVQYLVLNRGEVAADRDQALLDDLLSYEFAVVSDDQGILVAKRVHPPLRPQGRNPSDFECFARPSLEGYQPDMGIEPVICGRMARSWVLR